MSDQQYQIVVVLYQHRCKDSFFMGPKFPSTMQRVWPTRMNESVIVLFLLSTLDNRERIDSYFGLHNYLREGGKTLHARNVVQDNDVSLK